jgi:hypothetical protein
MMKSRHSSEAVVKRLWAPAPTQAYSSVFRNVQNDFGELTCMLGPKEESDAFYARFCCRSRAVIST